MIKRESIIVAIIAGLLLLSCSGFEKIMKSKDYDYKYTKALEFMVRGDYYHATLLFEQLQPIYNGTQRSDSVEYYLALGNYHQGDFLLAGHYFDKFRKTYPRSVFTEEAEYMYAYCYFESSPRSELDQDNTQAAIAAFSEFLSKYPQSSHKAEVIDILENLRNKLIEKSYLSAKLYYDIGEYKAAIVSIKNSLKDFPMSKYREEQLFLILKSSFLLADNSVPQKKKERFQSAVDEYYTLIGEYPETQYLKEAKRMYEQSMKALGTKQ